MTALKECIIAIWIPGQRWVAQGKFCLIGGKPHFIANMTEKKWIRKGAGYAIAKRILEKLPRGTQIIYKRLDLNTHYITTSTKFTTKGFLVAYGGHSQYVLPIKNWEARLGKPEGEPTDLPVLSLDKWLKTADPELDEREEFYRIQAMV